MDICNPRIKNIYNHEITKYNRVFLYVFYMLI